MLFRCILVLHNETKIFKLQLYSVLILINLNEQPYSCIFEFSSFLILINFLKKKLLYYNLARIQCSFFFFLLLRALCLYFFPTFSTVLPKTQLFICLTKSFLKSFLAFSLSSVLMTIYDFNHGSWLSLITLWTFLKNKSMI